MLSDMEKLSSENVEIILGIVLVRSIACSVFTFDAAVDSSLVVGVNVFMLFFERMVEETTLNAGSTGVLLVKLKCEPNRMRTLRT
jgi:hypothetical protein